MKYQSIETDSQQENDLAWNQWSLARSFALIRLMLGIKIYIKNILGIFVTEFGEISSF